MVHTILDTSSCILFRLHLHRIIPLPPLVHPPLFYSYRTEQATENIRILPGWNLRNRTPLLSLCPHHQCLPILRDRIRIKYSHTKHRTLLLHYNNHQQLFPLPPCRHVTPSCKNRCTHQQQKILVPDVLLRHLRHLRSYLFSYSLDN